MLQPKKTKFRKAHKGRVHGLAVRGSDLDYGQFGMKAVSAGRITARQIESARRAMTRSIRRGGRIWIRVFPDVPVSKKPAEVRQGKGKGNPEYWMCRIKAGRILYEIGGVSEEAARTAIRLAGAKLPIEIKFVMRTGDL
ncbi:MAG: 50S ribosomal protein L16 [Magnetococcales bacterium]|nr:50S ribosomal protein L16 [Magnetococcales bacterium]NGZ27509.1 50S ribosomal protein L16 [Magnetococcales bacterium]